MKVYDWCVGSQDSITASMMRYEVKSSSAAGALMSQGYKVAKGFDLQPGNLAAQPAGPCQPHKWLDLDLDLHGGTFSQTVRLIGL
eukprot:1143268-Pelagomonas_calceolata.AAC.1